VPQFTFGPQPLLTSPQVALPHDGGVQGVHVPPLHVVVPSHPPQLMLPLPHAFGTGPHLEPAPPSAPAHSGGSVPQTPP
jgi:hypothetical protein